MFNDTVHTYHLTYMFCGFLLIVTLILFKHFITYLLTLFYFIEYITVHRYDIIKRFTITNNKNGQNG